MNTPVNFEIAKLLKEKKFDENCSDYYTQRGNLNSNGWGDIIYAQGFGSGEPDIMSRFNYSDFNKNQKETCFLCPTIAEVVMWLYEKHGIWIISSYELVENNVSKEWFWIAKRDGKEVAYNYSGYKEPTEAYKAAIEYSLNNLI